MDYFYRNGHFDELLYIQSGNGLISTNFGDLLSALTSVAGASNGHGGLG